MTLSTNCYFHRSTRCCFPSIVYDQSSWRKIQNINYTFSLKKRQPLRKAVAIYSILALLVFNWPCSLVSICLYHDAVSNPCYFYFLLLFRCTRWCWFVTAFWLWVILLVVRHQPGRFLLQHCLSWEGTRIQMKYRYEKICEKQIFVT